MEKNTLIDFHSHILPGVDHGSKNMETSLKQVQYAKKSGVDILVSTSHFYPHQDTVRSFLMRRDAAYIALQEACILQGVEAPRIVLAAEVLLCRGMEKMEFVDRLCIGNTNVILLEMPLSKTWEKELIRSFLQIREMGLHPILAHAERYPKESVEELLQNGIEVQLNTESFHDWKKKKTCKYYIEKGCVVALGSDIHGVDKQHSHFAKTMKELDDVGVQIQRKTAQLICKELCK